MLAEVEKMEKIEGEKDGRGEWRWMDIYIYLRQETWKVSVLLLSVNLNSDNYYRKLII